MMQGVVCLINNGSFLRHKEYLVCLIMAVFYDAELFVWLIMAGRTRGGHCGSCYSRATFRAHSLVNPLLLILFYSFQHALKSYIRMFRFELEILKENLKQQEIAKRVETRKNGKVRKLDKLLGGWWRWWWSWWSQWWCMGPGMAREFFGLRWEPEAYSPASG